jgi:hypothetical protein
MPKFSSWNDVLFRHARQQVNLKFLKTWKLVCIIEFNNKCDTKDPNLWFRILATISAELRAHAPLILISLVRASIQ